MFEGHDICPAAKANKKSFLAAAGAERFKNPTRGSRRSLKLPTASEW